MERLMVISFWVVYSGPYRTHDKAKRQLITELQERGYTAGRVYRGQDEESFTALVTLRSNIPQAMDALSRLVYVQDAKAELRINDIIPVQ